MNSILVGLSMGGLALAEPPQAPAPLAVESMEVLDQSPRVLELEAQLSALQTRLERLEERCGQPAATPTATEQPAAIPPLPPVAPQAPEPPLAPEALVAPLAPVSSSLSQAATNVSGFSDALFVEAGQVVDDAVSFGGPVRVEGRVLGDAVSFGRDVVVANGAHVQGDAVSFGGKVIVEPGGAVDGDRVSYSSATAPSSGLASITAASASEWARSITRKLVMLLAFAGAGVLVVGTFPRQIENIAEAIRQGPLRSGLLGAAVAVSATILTLVLCITLIGIPLAMVLSAVVVVGWLLGFVAFCQFAGDQLPIANEGVRRWLAFLVGVMGLAFVSWLPVVGQLMLGAVGMVCLGAAARTRLGSRSIFEAA